MSPRISIIIPTKDRALELAELLASLDNLVKLAELQPEIIVANNNSQDNTAAIVAQARKKLAIDIKMIEVTRAGKSAAMNDAAKLARGDYLAFLDDDVMVDKDWLQAIADYIAANRNQAGQGRIGLYLPGPDNPAVRQLVEKFRTIPQLTHGSEVTALHSLNGANFFVPRAALSQVGGFDERLGPGASGTSEDVELARRLTAAGVRIGYSSDSVVYHRVDLNRLTEAYFAESHRRQGRSRLLIEDRGYAAILWNAARACFQFGVYSLTGHERRRYRSKGRIYHYLSMLEAKRKAAMATRG